MRTLCGVVLCSFVLAGISSLAAYERFEFLGPRGAELYLEGQTQFVRLRTRCKRIDLELSRDGGRTFTVLGTVDNVGVKRRNRNIFQWGPPIRWPSRRSRPSSPPWRVE